MATIENKRKFQGQDTVGGQWFSSRRLQRFIEKANLSYFHTSEPGKDVAGFPAIPEEITSLEPLPSGLIHD